ncbi:DUF3515 domain-containing protein [Mycobacterium intermedium]|uniref:DUF3515 domain-containing protein n=1 Tax=Mycobacterium intermedium TaxID=28445 RepID=UPI000B17CA14|nr:DUF3515 domain-containing protein [Mycobacterium intermedium]MCV6965659.1 DUF3515 domain-containing protein [Mycobacterium intermedium]
MPDPDGPPRALIIAAIALAVTALGVILAIATRHEPAKPVELPAVAAPDAGAPACQALLAALPRQLGDYQRTTVAQPAPEGAAAWRGGRSEPVILRCGLERPADFVIGSPIQVVDRVQWFQTAAGSGEKQFTWYAVDRPVYVALTLPAESGPTPIQEVSETIDRTMAAVPLRPGPPR